MVNNLKCCFCKKNCENEYGNNPWPLKTKQGGRCCNICNEKYVLTARSIMERDIKKVKEYIKKKKNL